MNNILLNILTIVAIFGALGLGYYFGIKDSFPMTCRNANKLPMIYMKNDIVYELCVEPTDNFNKCYTGCLNTQLDNWSIYYGIR
jgi:hypothetical protein